MPGIPATQEAETRRIEVPSQPPANSLRDPISKKPFTNKRASGVAQGVDPEFKLEYHEKKKEREKKEVLWPTLLEGKFSQYKVRK
jgi:hypothetical protein